MLTNYSYMYYSLRTLEWGFVTSATDTDLIINRWFIDLITVSYLLDSSKKWKHTDWEQKTPTTTTTKRQIPSEIYVAQSPIDYAIKMPISFGCCHGLCCCANRFSFGNAYLHNPIQMKWSRSRAIANRNKRKICIKNNFSQIQVIQDEDANFIIAEKWQKFVFFLNGWLSLIRWQPTLSTILYWDAFKLGMLELSVMGDHWSMNTIRIYFVCCV